LILLVRGPSTAWYIKKIVLCSLYLHTPYAVFDCFTDNCSSIVYSSVPFHTERIIVHCDGVLFLLPPAFCVIYIVKSWMQSLAEHWLFNTTTTSSCYQISHLIKAWDDTMLKLHSKLQSPG
jgi:TRAP-type mannitol/chloroaromatic compound transport system permease small subunit